MKPMLVTVVGPGGSRDVSLPGDVPISELMPTLIDLVGDGGGWGERGQWELAPPAGDPLPRTSSLAQSGVASGVVLYLRPWSQGELAPAAVSPEPVVGLTPIERTTELLPRRLPFGERLSEVVRAFVGAAQGSSIPPPSADAPALRPMPSETVDASNPSVPRPQDLTRARRPSSLERARRSWRASDHIERLDMAIVAPRLRRCATIAVMSPKGGVGKTTITALLGTLLALLRRDRAVAIDTNPDFGSLGRVLTPTHHLFVDDFLGLLDRPDLTLTSLDLQLGRAVHGLMVLPAPTEPKRMEKLDQSAYQKVIRRLQGLVGLVLLDCGTGLQEPAGRAALETCDQLVLVTDAEPAAASLVAEAGRLLVGSGRPIALVVNKMPTGGSHLDLARFAGFIPEARSISVVPNDADAAGQLTVGTFTWRDAPASWQRAIRELAAVLVAQWPHLGLTPNPTRAPMG